MGTREQIYTPPTTPLPVGGDLRDNGTMPVITEDIRIDAPPSDVTAVLLDADLAPAWTAGLERIELVDGIPGEPGCVGHAHYSGRRGGTVFVDVLEAVEPDRYFRSRITGSGITAVIETKLDEVDGATLLSLRWDGAGTNLVSALVLRFSARGLHRHARADLLALKDLVESRRT